MAVTIRLPHRTARRGIGGRPSTESWLCDPAASGRQDARSQLRATPSTVRPLRKRDGHHRHPRWLGEASARRCSQPGVTGLCGCTAPDRAQARSDLSRWQREHCRHCGTALISPCQSSLRSSRPQHSRNSCPIDPQLKLIPATSGLGVFHLRPAWSPVNPCRIERRIATPSRASSTNCMFHRLRRPI